MHRRQFRVLHRGNPVVSAQPAILEGNHLFNVDWFGKCGATGAPSVLSQNWDKLSPGQSVLVAIVGGGLTWGSFRESTFAARRERLPLSSAHMKLRTPMANKRNGGDD